MMTVYSWVRIRTQARQLRCKCAYLAAILPAPLEVIATISKTSLGKNDESFTDQDSHNLDVLSIKKLRFTELHIKMQHER